MSNEARWCHPTAVSPIETGRVVRVRVRLRAGVHGICFQGRVLMLPNVGVLVHVVDRPINVRGMVAHMEFHSRSNVSNSHEYLCTCPQVSLVANGPSGLESSVNFVHQR